MCQIIGCFLYNSIRLWCYININIEERYVSIYDTDHNLKYIQKKKKKEMGEFFSSEMFDFFVFLLLPREDRR